MEVKSSSIAHTLVRHILYDANSPSPSVIGECLQPCSCEKFKHVHTFASSTSTAVRFDGPKSSTGDALLVTISKRLASRGIEVGVKHNCRDPYRNLFLPRELPIVDDTEIKRGKGRQRTKF